MTLIELKTIILNASADTWHQHENGGGWVENTAHVDETVYVGPNALVCGNARVGDHARVGGYAMVGGYARVIGYAQVGDNAWVGDNARVCGGLINKRLPVYECKYTSNPAKPGYLRIGCQVHTFDEWRTNGRDIANKHNEQDWYIKTIEPVLEDLIKQAEELFEGQ